MGKLLTPFDFIVFILASLWPVLVVYRKAGILKKSTSFVEYALMGRKLTLPLFTASLVATWYGGIFGVAEIAFNKGIYSWVTQGLFWYLSYFIFALFLVNRVRKSHATTLAEQFGKSFGESGRKLCGMINYITLLPAAPLLGAIFLLQMFFPLGHTLSAIVVTALVLLYSWGRGLSAIVYSDLIQFLVMYFSLFLVVACAWSTIASPMEMLAKLPPEFLKLNQPGSDQNYLLWFLIALMPLVSPHFHHRCLAAKDALTAKKGILFSILCWIIFDLTFHLIIFYARAYGPTGLEAGQSLITFSFSILPPGASGLFLAGLLATILSTLDSSLFLAAVTLQHDVLGKRNGSGRRPILAMTAALALLLGIFLEKSIEEVWVFLGTLSLALLFLPYLLIQVFEKRFSFACFMISSICAVVAIIGNRIWGPFFPPPLDSNAFAGIVTTGCVFLIFGVKPYFHRV